MGTVFNGIPQLLAAGDIDFVADTIYAILYDDQTGTAIPQAGWVDRDDITGTIVGEGTLQNRVVADATWDADTLVIASVTGNIQHVILLRGSGIGTDELLMFWSFAQISTAAQQVNVIWHVNGIFQVI